jgi:hypothetical protein
MTVDVHAWLPAPFNRSAECDGIAIPRGQVDARWKECMIGAQYCFPFPP